MDDHLLDELLFAIGGLLLILALVAFRHARRFAARARKAEGRIAGFVKEDSDGGFTYFARIRFRDADGREHEISGPGLREAPVIDDEVAVSYDPKDPTNAWTPGCVAPLGIPILVLLAAVVLVIVGVILRFE